MAFADAEDALLLHIGPHKTGTTAVQGALAAARATLLSEAGILYPGTQQDHNNAAAAVTGRQLGWSGDRMHDGEWQAVVDEIHGHRGRAVLSSEVFCEASPEAINRLVGELGPERVRVVITLRPLEQLLPSSWQQYVKSGYEISYPDWLEDVLLSRDRRPVTPSFWVRNDHPALVRRWADAVGTENLLVVPVDRSSPRGLFDSFEDVLGVRRGLLSPPPENPSNRSLSAPEVEILRRLNGRARTALESAQYTRYVKRGAVQALVEGRTPAPDEPRVTTPRWAVERAREFSRSDVVDIEKSGVQVLGDLDTIAPEHPLREEAGFTGLEQVPTDLAAQFLLGVLTSTMRIAEADRAGLAARLEARIASLTAPAPAGGARAVARRVVGRARRTMAARRAGRAG